MKQDIFKSLLIGLLLLTAGKVYANSGAPSDTEQNKVTLDEIIQDSTAVFIYTKDSLTLENSEAGKLYLYAEGKEGYKAIYYLFTSRPYIHLGNSSTVTKNDFYMIKEQKGKWINISNGNNAASDRKYSMNEKQTYRCIVRDGKETQLLLSINSNGKLTDNTILLVILPELEEAKLEYSIKHGDSTMTFDEFKEVKLNSENDKPLDGYNLQIKRPNSIVIDSITCVNPVAKLKINDKDNYHDTPLQDGMFVIPIGGITLNRKCKDVKFCIYYRMFGEDGKIESKNEYQTLELKWEGTGGNSTLWIVGSIIILLVVVACVIKKKGFKKTIPNQGDGKDFNKGNSEGGSFIDKGKDEKEKAAEKKSSLYGKKNKNIDWKKEFYLLIEENEKLSKTVDSLTREKTNLEKEKGYEKQRADNAEQTAKEAAKIEIEKINRKADLAIAAANSKAQSAEKRAAEAEDRANKNAEEKIKKVELEYQKKLAEEEKKTKLAEQEVEKEKEKSKKEIVEAKAEVMRERGEELAKLIGLAKRLKSLLNKIPDDAFVRNGLVLKSGVDSYCNNLESVVNKNLSLKRSIDEMREYSLVQLGIGSSCWIHCLGRLYSYLSVKTLRNQLEYEGVNTDTLTEAFRTLVVLLAAQGIVVQNCSIGFDSITDSTTNNLFELDMMVDRITNWLGGSDRVCKAIPNHGNTIYDFGTLAYYSVESIDVHQGKVMYYDE